VSGLQTRPAENPNGIPSQSPRLRGTSYLGKASAYIFQPQRGCVRLFRPSRATFAATALRLSRFATFTQGRRVCANLGLWAAAPLGLERIPTGFSPSAQGCEERATLGHGSQMETNRNAVATKTELE
jgi:hypothetical protein